jgi:hypothetical protein
MRYVPEAIGISNFMNKIPIYHQVVLWDKNGMRIEDLPSLQKASWWWAWQLYGELDMEIHVCVRVNGDE